MAANAGPPPSRSRRQTAAGCSLDRFVQLTGDGAQDLRSVPLLGFALAGQSGHCDESGFPSGKGWTEVALLPAEDGHSFALEVSGDALAPAYRDGDIPAWR